MNLWPVRIRPVVGESLDSFIARQATAMDCSILHAIRSASDSPDVDPPRVSIYRLADKSGIDPRDLVAMTRWNRPHPAQLGPVRLPARCTWTCPTCVEMGVTARDADLLLDFGCLEHKCLKLGSDGTGGGDLDDDLADILRRIRATLGGEYDVTGVADMLRAVAELLEWFPMVAMNTSYGSAEDEHPFGRRLRDAAQGYGADSPHYIAEYLRNIWPIVETPSFRTLALLYLRRFDKWRESHPDPRLRGTVYGTQETVPLWNAIGLADDFTRLRPHLARGHEAVPHIYVTEADTPYLDGDERADALWWRRGLACQMVRHLFRAQEQPRQFSDGGRPSCDVPQTWRPTDRYRDHLDVVTTVGELAELAEILGGRADNTSCTGRLGLSDARLSHLAPSIAVDSHTTDVVELWLWMHRTEGTDAQAHIPWQPLNELKRIDRQLPAEEKLALLDFQETLLSELGTPANWAPSHAGSRNTETA